MNDIEKKLKGYYTRSLEHNSDFASLAAKANLVKSKPTPWFKKKIVIFPSLGVLCAGAATAIVIGVANGLNSPTVADIKNAVIKMEHRHSTYYLSVDDRGYVESMYSDDDEAKMITANETIVGKHYWDATRKIIDSEIASGYYTRAANTVLKFNKTSFTVYAEDGNYKDVLKRQVVNYVNSKNIATDDETIETTDSEAYSEIAEDNSLITINDNDDFDSVQSVIDEYYKEVAEYNTAAVENFVALSFYYQDKIAYFESAIKTLENEGKSVTTFKNKVDELKTKTKGYMDVYSNLFIKDGCSYMTKYQEFLDAKVEILSEILKAGEIDNASLAGAYISMQLGTYDQILLNLQSFRETMLNTLTSTLDEMASDLENIIPTANEEEFRQAVVSSGFYKDYLARSSSYIASFKGQYKSAFEKWNNMVVETKAEIQNSLNK